MIVQTYMVILTLSVGLISDVTCTSYSNVYVESDVAPVGYYSYGIPYPAIANPRLSQINSLPSVPGYVTVHPTHAVTHGNYNPNVVTYHAPSAPIVIAPNKQEPTGYEYSYVVYDQNTGDHKAQRELSDGSVVRGEYSFLQPDGYVREVQYVADDVSGFNAVVKKFRPVAEEDNKKGTTNEHKESPPCHEIKSESLKEGSVEKSGEISMKHSINLHEKLHEAHRNEKSDVKSKEHSEHSTPKESNNHSKPKESHEEENSKEKHHPKPKHSHEESDEKSKKHTQHSTPKDNNNHSKSKESQEEENSKETYHLKSKHSKEETEEKPKHISEENSSEESEEANHKKCTESVEKSKDNQHVKFEKESKELEEESEEESESEESKENYRKIPSGGESEDISHGKHQEVHELLKPSNEAVLPYKDIIRCIEAAMRKNDGVPAAIRQEHSPLTYIVLNKPC
ncbi:hypothetical protein PYW08_014647 [Mythimna loreyi]|uniref:Uncharacterized protein n=1 Tax=Mythimna loreyi TaxID=667449 RepID=A0ACC2R3S0_9NEOP|nr:hypothetical protein PYW08_014647 [Mythimna loreyi]